MRTDSFSWEKHLPVRRFIADESKIATGLYGPRAIADDIDNIHAMFDPQAELLNGTEKGGIGEKNLQDGAVSLNKLHPELKETISGAVSEQQFHDFRTEYEQKLEEKAQISDTLDGYGIKDAYTKTEVDNEISKIADEIVEYVDASDTSLSGQLEASRKDIAKKTEETVLYEDVVNTPVWTNQPTFDGVLDSAFNTDNFYYVTLKDENGNTLPDGQFMLKDFYTEDTAVYSTVFSLANLDTGAEILVENYPVEFISVGVNFGMRDAGVWQVAYNPSNWKLGGNFGQLRLVCDGQFIQRMSTAYFIAGAATNKNVSHYHSVEATAFQSDSSKQIFSYAPLGNAGSYKINKFYDELVIERLSDTRYLTERKTTIRSMSYGGNTFKVISNNVIGHGEILNEGTLLTKINIQVASDKNRGFIRNGSVIRVTEVK